MIQIPPIAAAAVRVLSAVAHRALSRAAIGARLDLAPSLIDFALDRLGEKGFLRKTASGWALGRPASRISLLDIVTSVEGGIPPDGICLLRNPSCAIEGDCLLHPACEELRGRTLELLSEITIAELAANGRGIPQS